MKYEIEQLNQNNAEYYARVNALAWKQSYKKLIDNDFLENMNKDEEIKKATNSLIDGLTDGSKRFLLKVNDEYVGILRVRKTKYEKYSNFGELGALYVLNNIKGLGFGKLLFNKAKEELKSMGYDCMIIGCLVNNPSNEFYKHMGGKLIDVGSFKMTNNQEMKENIYYYDI